MNAERLVLHSFLLILQVIFCTSKDSINTNQFVKDGEFLISKGNNFALGFFSPGKSSNRYLGIWYYKIPDQTVVWVANRNNPIIGSSGVLSFDKYGNLVLYSDSNQNVSVWSANVSGEEADTSVAQLLDSGNLILVQESGNIVWQSFHYPTHYALPGMKIGLDLRTGLDRFLTSWRSADDPGVGDYSFKVNPSGSPQFFLYKGEKRVSRTSPWPWRPLRNIYNAKFVNDQDEIGITSVIPDDDSIMGRLLVDHSGFVKSVKWDESDGQWKEVWRAPRSQCDSYGWCGAYSTCEPTDINKFECSCLPGYEPKNPSDWLLRNGSAGCVRKRLESSSVCMHGEGFVKVEIVFLPDTSAAVWVDMSTSQANCERECKRNCSCSAYASIDIPDKGRGCLTWYGELRDAVRFKMSDRYELYVRVDTIELAENARKSNDFLGKEISAILIPSVASALLVVSIRAYFWLKKRGNKGKTEQALLSRVDKVIRKKLKSEI
ncbi:unnamed protein product [Dovyalis caffra]|uniref:non-specific serine/threonine protein kinase n=1 Tax=Dovyalis caffra TaxID=77055 RepID=A0AAV1SHV2_9ROSI|nr:unnamed protein product [Dovyalis caffra]